MRLYTGATLAAERVFARQGGTVRRVAALVLSSCTAKAARANATAKMERSVHLLMALASVLQVWYSFVSQFHKLLLGIFHYGIGIDEFRFRGKHHGEHKSKMEFLH